jgi:hypothetical protein
MGRIAVSQAHELMETPQVLPQDLFMPLDIVELDSPVFHALEKNFASGWYSVSLFNE